MCGPSVLASGTVNTVADCIKRNNGAVSSFRRLRSLLRPACFPVYASTDLFGVSTSAVAVATLGRSGWLILSPQGLSPCKKRQASLGALTALALSPERRASPRRLSLTNDAPLVDLLRKIRSCVTAGRFVRNPRSRHIFPVVTCRYHRP